MSTLKDKLVIQTDKELTSSPNKVSIVGVGDVGMACAFTLVQKGLVSDLVLVDILQDKLKGEMMDLQHSMAFVKPVNIVADTDYKVTAGSKVCIVTAGVRQRVGESRPNLVNKNVEIFKSIIPQLVKYSPETIILVVSNPVDVLTYVAWKISGLPHNRVIGSGTNLDSARFRFILGQELGIAPSSCHAWIIGEHGDSSVPVWSGVNVAGTLLKSLNADAGIDASARKLDGLHKKVFDSAYQIIHLKGYTSWAIGLSVATLIQSILRNENKVFAVSTLIKGFREIKDQAFISLPCILGSSGVIGVLNQHLSQDEAEKLKNSVSIVVALQNRIDIKTPEK
ncbi:L-lactate dehydrogenase B chain-like [Saccoglossus kowalevskii]|uniref:L-lactate dehydrogenase n=1 Tax=Saccoglossus kowalevskii TaxID=10224 RepID=A0ABM0N0V9_SACKO|nr:PREDICTED: L-lactate dehydrogenase B chain-like [Saccoglossus kowalevskii]